MAALLALLALFALDSAGAHAADTDSLARQIKTLSDRVKTLESQVQQLEQRFSSSPPTAANTAPPAVSVRDAWRGIKEGLTKDEVKQALGVPQQQFMLSGKLLWYYSYPGIGAGSVMFGENERVIGSQEPPGHW